jgi:hypothetical protein
VDVDDVDMVVDVDVDVDGTFGISGLLDSGPSLQLGSENTLPPRLVGDGDGDGDGDSIVLVLVFALELEPELDRRRNFFISDFM